MYSSNMLCAMVASGSFGHFQASKSGVHKGGLYQPLVKAGFVATRISVRLCLVDRFTSMDFALSLLSSLSDYSSIFMFMFISIISGYKAQS